MSKRVLADVCASIDYGYTASASTTPSGPRFLRITDIVGGPPQWRNVPFCDANEAIASKFRLNDGDIVIARTGATTGFSTYIENPPKAVFASYLVRLTIDRAVADPKFVSYYLKGPQFWNYVRGVLGDKSAQPNASAKTLTMAPIDLPVIEAQRSIAFVLGSLDDKIEQNRRTSHALEALARATFKAWFVDFEPVKAKAAGQTSFPGMPADAFAALPDRLTNSSIGVTPEGWKTGAMGDVGVQRRSQLTPSEVDAATPYIGLEHMPRRDLVLSAWGTAASVTSSKFRFQHRDILFGKLRPYFHKVGPAPLDGVCST